MKRLMTLLLAAALMMALLLPAAMAADAQDTYYVYTENHKALNARSTPNGEIVGTIPYGTEVKVISYLDDDWAMVTVHFEQTGELQACVNRRYLISMAPDALEQLLADEGETVTGDLITDINAEFASAVDVEPYEISIRPTRVTSWANMRWIPSEQGRILARYKAGEKLIVLKVMNHYLQVQDPDTGDVGYIHIRYAIR